MATSDQTLGLHRQAASDDALAEEGHTLRSPVRRRATSDEPVDRLVQAGGRTHRVFIGVVLQDRMRTLGQAPAAAAWLRSLVPRPTRLLTAVHVDPTGGGHDQRL